ncbi:MAG: toll/interleukin-1 receptor domain-containing protein [Steroidobacteraceae bacterium]
MRPENNALTNEPGFGGDPTTLGSRRAVFISYASEDADTAQRICATLRAADIEVWFDQSELKGGDAWDAAIRKQIKACALFIAVVSANTRARVEGYFRLEWKLAIDRSHLMAAEKAFLLPVVIDGTREADALVPDKFHEVQWSLLPAGVTPPAFVARVARLLSPDAPVDSPAPRLPAGADEAAPAKPFTAASAERSIRPPAPPANITGRTWLTLAVAAVLIAGALFWFATQRGSSWRNPLASARFSRLSEIEGLAPAAAISRDGKSVAFLASHEGRTDIWVTEIGSDKFRNLTRDDPRVFVNNPQIRTLGFSPDSSLVSVWTRHSDGSEPEDVNVLAVPTKGVRCSRICRQPQSSIGRAMAPEWYFTRPRPAILYLCASRVSLVIAAFMWHPRAYIAISRCGRPMKRISTSFVAYRPMTGISGAYSRPAWGSNG